MVRLGEMVTAMVLGVKLYPETIEAVSNVCWKIGRAGSHAVSRDSLFGFRAKQVSATSTKHQTK